MCGRLAPVVFLPTLSLAAGRASAAPGDPEVFAVVGGDPINTVVAAGEIPAILEPELVSGEEAAAQMLPEEPVLGVIVAGQARA